MDKMYVLKQITYSALCCYTGVMDFQNAFDEAKSVYGEWKSRAKPLKDMLPA